MSPFVPGSIAAVAIAGALGGVLLTTHQSTAQQGHPRYDVIVQAPTAPSPACALTGPSPAAYATAPARPTPACQPLQLGATTAP